GYGGTVDAWLFGRQAYQIPAVRPDAGCQVVSHMGRLPGKWPTCEPRRPRARIMRSHSPLRNVCHGCARTPGATACVGTSVFGDWWTRTMDTARAFGRVRFMASARRCIGAAIAGVTVRPALHSTSVVDPPRPGTMKS